MASYVVSVASDVLGQPAGNLTFNMTRPLDLTQGAWEMAIVQFSCWYSYFNFSLGDYNNTRFVFTDVTGTARTATLRDGVYSANALCKAVKDKINELAGSATADAIVLFVNEPTLGFGITINNSACSINFSAAGTSNMYVNLGASITTYTTSAIFPDQADITSGTNILNVRTPIVSTSTLNGQPSTILYSFAPNNAPGGLLAYTPQYPVFVGVPNGTVSSLQLLITDQKGRIVNFRNGTGNRNNGSTFTILFRQRASA